VRCPMNADENDGRSLLHALLGDGRPLLLFTGLALVLSGGFALFLAANGQFLPHDVQYLGTQAETLCSLQQCRIVHFMIHDRVAFGGALIAVGSLYMWLAEFPLRHGQAWAWWTLLLTGVMGFSSFLAYLGYGYLDTWHGVATLLLLPCFIVGLYRSYRIVDAPKSFTRRLTPVVWGQWNSALGIGRLCLIATALGMIAGGSTILIVGMTTIFVPQDLAYMGLNAEHLRMINPRLLPLIAHDRAGFGGAIATCGMTVLACVCWAKPSRSLWQILCWSGCIGFATAIGIHAVIGYTDAVHLTPAIAGAFLFCLGLVLCAPHMLKPGASRTITARRSSEQQGI
jgi:hypothetical protein